MSTNRGVGFLGRTRERRRLDAMLAQARDGQSAVLVIRGEPGIGKTALLRYAARQASGLRLAEVEGVQAEMELAYAAIHRLCVPMLDEIEALSAPQQDSVRAALGIGSGHAPDRFLVAVAVLNLLSATAEKRPLLCLVDDAQWLDAASMQALGFVARRLAAEPVAMIFSLREPATTRAVDGLPHLTLEGLDEPEARALLSRAVPGRLDDRVRNRIIAETGGNPLALLELSRRMNPSERAGGFAPPAASDLPGRLEQGYQRRIAALPEATQRLMLLAAAEPLGDAGLVWRAADQLSTDPGALAAATEAGLLKIDDRVRFHHPFVRSAVLRAASLDERRRAHGALAQVSDPELAPERRAWHLAAAAAGPDEEVALQLENSAGRARARGGFAAAAAFLQRALALTQDPERRAARALAAGEAAFQAGAFDEASRLVATAQALPLSKYEQAQVALIRGEVAFATGLSGDAPPLLLEAAGRLEQFDLERARQTYLIAWGAATVAPTRLPGRDGLQEISRAILGLPRGPAAPRPLDLLLEGLALLVIDGRAAATPTLHKAAKALADIPVEDVLRWGWMATAACNAIWDNDGAHALAARQAQLVRDAGALAELPLYLSALGLARAWTGDLEGAASNVTEADSLAAASGGLSVPWTKLRLLALQGREAETATAITSAIEQAAAGAENLAIHSHWAAAVLYNGLGRYGEAVAAARQAVSNTFEYWVSAWALPELVEAAARLEDTATARRAFERLAETTRPCNTNFALGIEARCCALLSSGTTAENLYHEAIERFSRTNLRPELGRAHLVFGEWLRREARGAEARNELHAAHDAFVAVGMQAFAERARRALAATGERSRKPAPRAPQLTAQEEQIARLAREGLTNAEIGGQLFLSPRTVEYHLHKVFEKLQINSRSGLEGALPG